MFKNCPPLLPWLGAANEELISAGSSRDVGGMHQGCRDAKAARGRRVNFDLRLTKPLSISDSWWESAI